MTETNSEHRVMQEVAPGIWRPAIPLKAPIDIRWRCDHRFIPIDSMIGWACIRCGVERDGMPPDGHDWPYRLWRRLRKGVARA